jgi:hypothetical protein
MLNSIVVTIEGNSCNDCSGSYGSIYISINIKHIKHSPILFGAFVDLLTLNGNTVLKLVDKDQKNAIKFPTLSSAIALAIQHRCLLLRMLSYSYQKNSEK